MMCYCSVFRLQRPFSTCLQPQHTDVKSRTPLSAQVSWCSVHPLYQVPRACELIKTPHADNTIVKGHVTWNKRNEIIVDRQVDSFDRYIITRGSFSLYYLSSSVYMFSYHNHELDISFPSFLNPFRKKENKREKPPEWFRLKHSLCHGGNIGRDVQERTMPSTW